MSYELQIFIQDSSKAPPSPLQTASFNSHRKCPFEATKNRPRRAAAAANFERPHELLLLPNDQQAINNHRVAAHGHPRRRPRLLNSFVGRSRKPSSTASESAALKTHFLQIHPSSSKTTANVPHHFLSLPQRLPSLRQPMQPHQTSVKSTSRCNIQLLITKQPLVRTARN